MTRREIRAIEVERRAPLASGSNDQLGCEALKGGLTDSERPIEVYNGVAALKTHLMSEEL